ncbi:MAG: hypothetical protein Q9196_002747 [Gyalolechia fulgens]
MGMLSRVLPAPVFRFLKKAINPPKAPEDKSKQYTDLLVMLEISRDAMDSSLQLLRSLVRLRFTNKDSARNFVVDEKDFQNWLAQGEDKGYWTCCMYQVGFALVAGFDRGRSGRTIISSHPRAKARKTTPAPRPTPTRKSAMASISTAISHQEGKGKGMAKQSETPSIEPEVGYEDIGMQERPAAEEEVSHEEMSEVRRGKRRER